MDQKLLREREALCTQENPPRCTAECPVHVDVRGMIAALLKGNTGAAFKLYSKSVPFPGIISRICEQPCGGTCLRRKIDQPVSIRELERFIAASSGASSARVITAPRKDQRVAIVGSGLGGLMTARALTLKGYRVTVFEKSGELGGRIRSIPESILPEAVIEADFAQLHTLPLDFRLNTEVGMGGAVSLQSLQQEFSAVYLDVGLKSLSQIAPELKTDEHGALQVNPISLETSCPEVFAGGSLLGGRESHKPIASVSDGRIAANSIDRLLQNVSLTADRSNEGSVQTQLYTSIEGEKQLPPVHAENPETGYTAEEAGLEAERCLQCECLECVKSCVYLAHYKGYPKKYFREIYNNLSIVMGIHHANKLINTCSECGLCAHICPNGADMGEICHEARSRMVEKGKMPPSAHDFALRDMQFSTGEGFALVRHQPGLETSKVLFFPGCQLAGSSPGNVEKIYGWLCQRMDDGVGLMLNCCGAPAQWAGQNTLFRETLTVIRGEWERMGKPSFITACPSCFAMFRQYQPEMPVEMLYTVLDRIGLPEQAGSGMAPKMLAIHDSCTTRYESGLHESVRNLMTKLGHTVEELPGNRDYTSCCGFGGLMMFSNKEVARAVISRRVGESPSDYAVYCAMCRDNFVGQSKPVYHLLDLLFGTDEEQVQNRKGPDFSQRHENRARLKRTLMNRLWGDSVEEMQVNIRLDLTEEIRWLMEERMILEEDIRQVLTAADQTGKRIWNSETERYTAYHKPGSVTYWVEYSILENGYRIHNTYSHRLEIGE